jgi:hypothetical protein
MARQYSYTWAVGGRGRAKVALWYGHDGYRTPRHVEELDAATDLASRDPMEFHHRTDVPGHHAFVRQVDRQNGVLKQFEAHGVYSA